MRNGFLEKRRGLRGKTAVLAMGCAAVFCASALTACSGGGTASPAGREPAESDLFAMDTYMKFTAYGSGAEQALERVEEEICELEARWSVTDENSEIWKADHSGGGPVELSEDTARLLEFTLDVAEKTDGALDPTIYPVLEAWGFTTDENQIPDEETLRRRLEKVGYEQVNLSGNILQLPEGVELDLGAVGKGAAGDLAAEILKEEGISSALLDIGSNMQAVGKKTDGSEWHLGIRNPFGEGVVGDLYVSDCAVVTSGNYERYFIGEDGKRYGHIIDPETGYPADNGLASATIVAPEGKAGDALSTAMFVKGLEGAADYWRTYQDFEMILVTEEEEVWITEGLEGNFRLSGEGNSMELRVIAVDG